MIDTISCAVVQTVGIRWPAVVALCWLAFLTGAVAWQAALALFDKQLPAPPETDDRT